jgi:hypothetical protein
VRNETLGKFAAFYSDSWRGQEPLPAAPASVAAAPSVSTPETSLAETMLAPEAERNIASTEAPEGPSLPAGSGALLGINQSSEMLKDLLSADLGNENENLFRRVSNRYRLLSPGLLGKR